MTELEEKEAQLAKKLKELTDLKEEAQRYFDRVGDDYLEDLKNRRLFQIVFSSILIIFTVGMLITTKHAYAVANTTVIVLNVFVGLYSLYVLSRTLINVFQIQKSINEVYVVKKILKP